MEQASTVVDLRYPVGRFQVPATITAADRARYIEEIRTLPDRLRAAIAALNRDQMNTPYRDGGWTPHQVVHHFADSHMNSFIRCKLALTEQSPTIKPYDEAAWAVTGDTTSVPVEASLAILDGLHRRWVALFESLTDADFQRTFSHPELGVVRLDVNLALYAWHCRHHTAHITSLRRRMNW
jgi:hypothetical protein